MWEGGKQKRDLPGSSCHPQRQRDPTHEAVAEDSLACGGLPWLHTPDTGAKACRVQTCGTECSRYWTTDETVNETSRNDLGGDECHIDHTEVRKTPLDHHPKKVGGK